MKDARRYYPNGYAVFDREAFSSTAPERKIADCFSITVARRIANALNKYQPKQRLRDRRVTEKK